ncbi:hypothetical protein ABT119_35255 [Streptomyces sp. NPDC001910]|uniref:hypothetical protein n=1 Tax=Streptomyces sp. NPDC001910 TaxID=3154403 RepID=UPI00333229F8
MAESASDGPLHVDFPPVLNGMDYLASVVDHLSGTPTPRDLKYAVLHLQAATEVLLKARLLQEHWSLVFRDPGRADRGRFESGDFESCGTNETIGRLRSIIGISLPKPSVDEINQLAKWRNALQHYGLTAGAPAVESRAAHILDFLLVFVSDQLLPGLSGADSEYAGEGLYHIRSQLSEMRAVIKARMDRLRPVLAPATARTVMCPDCGQVALTVGTSPLQCHFCEEEFHTATILAEFYVGVALGKEWEPGFEDRTKWPISKCSDCGEEALVLEADTAASPGSPTRLCFACGTVSLPQGGAAPSGLPESTSASP